MDFGHDSGQRGPWDMAYIPEEDDSDDFDTLDPRERATNPDLAFAAEMADKRAKEIEAARAELQRKLSDPATYSRRREVMLHIMKADGLLEDELKRGAGSNRGGRDMHMEFASEWSNIVYVYYTKDCQSPFYQLPKKLNESRPKVPLNHCGATVLVRVDCWNDEIIEIHRWEEDD